MAAENDFRTVDYILFVLSLVFSLGIGLWSALHGNKKNTTDEYLMGNRQLNPLAVTMSIFMSFISSILIVSNPAEMYLWGSQYWLMCVAGAFGYALVAYFIVPFFYKLKLVSAYEVRLVLIENY